jgi:2-keto-4-pentenoate hydratase/2-oxohepta-3-ene-1,7-dioic acid hydratase in catechol pathway
MLALIRGGSGALDLARRLTANAPAAASLEASSVRLLCPLPVPESVRCFGGFEGHSRNSAKVMLKKMAALAADPVAEEARLKATGNFDLPQIWFDRPLYYKGNRFSFVGPEVDVVWPDYSQVVDYELELACIIGKAGRDIPKDRAAEHIFGFSICNDLSARDEQSIEMRAPLGPAKGKDFDGGNIMGPCIVTADEIDPYNLNMLVRVDGDLRGQCSSSAMHHRFEDDIAYASRSETVHPGEVFLSGCAADGSGMEIDRTLVRDVTIELEIESIGVLRNRIL